MVLAMKAVAGLGLLLALAFAAWGRPPSRGPGARDVARVLVAAVVLYAVAALAASLDHVGLAEGTCAGGVLAAAFGGWLSRGGEGDEGPDDDGSPVDWDDFDHARRDWERPREPSPRRGDVRDMGIRRAHIAHPALSRRGPAPARARATVARRSARDGTRSP